MAPFQRHVNSQPKKISSQSFKLSAKQSFVPSQRNDVIDQEHRIEKIVDREENYFDDDSIGEHDLLEAAPPNLPTDKVLYKSELTGKQKAGQALVSNHRAVTTRWLSMIKNEMTSVNQVDADREGLDDYLLELQNLQRTQIGFLSELRGSLQKYVSAAEGPHQTAEDQDDDDSFEDLRD